MPYRKPPVFVQKVFNPLAMMLGMSGTVTLAVPGRRTGAEQRVPVIPVDVAGSRYLVSPRGETDWVHNLRAAGGGELRTKGRSERFRAREIPESDRSEILAAYREKAGRAVKSHFDALPSPGDHPVFRVDAS